MAACQRGGDFMSPRSGSAAAYMAGEYSETPARAPKKN